MKTELKTLFNEPENCLVVNRRKMKRRIFDIDNHAGDITGDQITGPYGPTAGPPACKTATGTDDHCSTALKLFV